MSYFDDYIEDGLCCESCGALLDMDEPGFVRLCDGCRKPAKAPSQVNALANFDLTTFMRDNGILRIARNPHGFSVYIEGDILGTGETVAEAFENAARQRDYHQRKAA